MKTTTTTRTTGTTGERAALYFVNALMCLLGTGVASTIVYTFFLVFTN